MKPYIVYITADGDSVTMPKAKLEQLVQEAYEQGKADACKADVYPLGTWTTHPYTPNYYNPGVTGIWPFTTPTITYCGGVV